MDRPIKKDKKKGSRGGMKFRKKSSGEQKNDEDTQWHRGGRTAIVWVLFIVAFLFIFHHLGELNDPDGWGFFFAKRLGDILIVVGNIIGFLDGGFQVEVG